MSIYDKSSLVLIPSGTKTGKVFSQKPVSGDGDFTFTRASAATRVNADGNIEKETINLFRYSEEFNQGSAWSKQGGAQISPNASTAPDGTNTADLLYPSISGVVKAAIQSFTSASGTQYAQSIYVKASGKNFAALYALNGSAGPAMWVNLTTGAITNGSTPNVVGRFATSVGDGWWRIGFADLGNGTIGYMHIYPTDTAGSQNVTANGTDGILIWGGQLNYGSVAQEYIKTTTAAVYGGITDNTPRLDYTDSSCPALLLEPQRTNLVDYSEYYDLFHQNVTLTTNADTSPEGVDNASKIVVSSTSQPRIERFNTWSNSTTYTMSGYVKADTGRYIGFGLYSPEMGNQWVRFDLTNETFVYSDTNWSNAAIVDAGDDWYRLSATMTTDAVNSSRSGFKLATMKSNSYNTGTIGDSFFVYGLQLEVGSYATSYIPTYGSSVTRARDENYKAGIGSLLNDSEGTLFLEVKGISNGGDSRRLSISDGTTNNRVVIEIDEVAGRFKSFMSKEGNTTGTLTSSNNVQTDTNKIAVTYTSSIFKMFLNGVKVATDTTIIGSPIGLEIIRFANATNNHKMQGFVKQTLVIPTAITDQEAIDLTTI
jgi:hypothetical protein